MQNSIPTWYGPIADPATGRWITSHVMNQDFVTWVGQGRIADRSQGISRPERPRHRDDAPALSATISRRSKQGRDPKAIIRDPAVNRAIPLPVAERRNFIEGFTARQMLRDPFGRRNLQGYIFQTGQPAEVREAFLAAMGFTEAEAELQPDKPLRSDAAGDPAQPRRRKKVDPAVFLGLDTDHDRRRAGADAAQRGAAPSDRRSRGARRDAGAFSVRSAVRGAVAARRLARRYAAGPLPPVTLPFLWWILVASLSQIAATALLLRCMQERNFALGVAYAKTELLQIAMFGLVLLGDRITVLSVAAILVATAGVILVSLPKEQRSLRAIAGGWTSRAALLGVGSGTAFGLAAVGYRGAALALDTPSILLAAAYSLVWAQALQTLLLGGYLLWRQRRVVVAVVLAWRVSLLAGAMGAIGSACWFTAMALEPVANVRTLGLIELFFSYLVSRRFFRERLTAAELIGFVLLALGLVGIVGQF